MEINHKLNPAVVLLVFIAFAGSCLKQTEAFSHSDCRDEHYTCKQVILPQNRILTCNEYCIRRGNLGGIVVTIWRGFPFRPVRICVCYKLAAVVVTSIPSDGGSSTVDNKSGCNGTLEEYSAVNRPPCSYFCILYSYDGGERHNTTHCCCKPKKTSTTPLISSPQGTDHTSTTVGTPTSSPQIVDQTSSDMISIPPFGSGDCNGTVFKKPTDTIINCTEFCTKELLIYNYGYEINGTHCCCQVVTVRWETTTTTTPSPSTSQDNDLTSTTTAASTPEDNDLTSSTTAASTPEDNDLTSTTTTASSPQDNDLTSTTTAASTPEDNDLTSTTTTTPSPPAFR